MRIFNPGLLADGAGYVLACRVVLPDLIRRIAILRLCRALRVIPGSQSALSDQVRFSPRADLPDRARAWFADPRLFRLGGRIFVSWNSGWHDPANYQFLQELDARTLLPIGPPRELRLPSGRRPLEKNWTFFGDGPVHAVYSVAPHRVLRCSLDGDGPIDLSDCAVIEWEAAYAREHGALRGGAPPQALGGRWYSFCHSILPSASPEGHRYVAAVYRFEARHPFAPTDGPARPLALPNPFGAHTVHERLTPAVGEVSYPSGAAFDNGSWTIGYGINDEHCAIARVPHDEVLAALRSVRPG